jgi:hypothetical protein
MHSRGAKIDLYIIDINCQLEVSNTHFSQAELDDVFFGSPGEHGGCFSTYWPTVEHGTTCFPNQPDAHDITRHSG